MSTFTKEQIEAHNAKVLADDPRHPANARRDPTRCAGCGAMLIRIGLASACPKCLSAVPPGYKGAAVTVSSRSGLTVAPPAAAAAGGKKPPKPKSMNLTEQRFAALLEARRQAGEIAEYRWEGVTLKLADGCRYTPDFFTVTPAGRVTLYEVKGAHIWDDSKVKFKVAKEQVKGWAVLEMHQWDKDLQTFIHIL